MSDKKPAIFIAGPDEKALAQNKCNEIINVIQRGNRKDLLFQAYVLQMLLESFEETYDIDIKNGVSISDNR